MAYVIGNPKSKAELKRWLQDPNRFVEVFQPGLGTVPVNGTICLEGPHYPQAHTWYATGTMENGVLVKVK